MNDNPDRNLPRPQQLDLWDGQPVVSPRHAVSPAHANSATSREAAESISPQTRIHRLEIVLKYIVDCGSVGATNDEITIDLGLLLQSVTSLTNRLKIDELIRESGEKRPTRTGCNAAILIATALGKQRAK